MTDLENELAIAVEESALLKATPNLHVVAPKGEPTLTDYLATIERAQQQFREKIRRGRLAVIEDHDRRWAELDASTKRQLSEMTARIEREHAEARLALEAETRASLREIDDLAKRMGE